ncbi:MAG: NADH-quinone oxidoreductase subunit H, partial [Phycisphaerae bacterium]
MITGSGFITVLFLGGWHLPGVPGLQPQDVSVWAMLFKMLVMGLKIVAFLFFFMWIRWTLPRFRFDQLMRLSWKGLLPISMLLAGYATVLVYLGKGTSIPWALGGNMVALLLVIAYNGMGRSIVTGREASMPALAVQSPAKSLSR